MKLLPSLGLVLLLLAAPAPPRAQTQAPTRDQLAKDNKLFITLASKTLKWEEPAEPVRIAGPLYFVGTQGLGVYLITTSDGLVLINTGMPSSGPMIAASIRKLGFKPEDIKVLVTSHAHADHAGGIAYLKDLSGGKLAMMEADIASMEDGGKSDFHYGTDWKVMGFPAAKVDRVLRDGDTVKLGDIVLTALATPGHTRGDTTWTTTIVDGGKAYVVVWPDGMSVNPGYALAGHPSYPGIADDFRRTAARLELLKPDIWLVSHTERFDIEGKRTRAKTQGVAAWVDPEGYRRYIAAQRQAFEDEMNRELGVEGAVK
ncbi:subclass B3 metallo-beta-lactamase [Caulobacter sp. Root1455]|uniref:subclass B3 metallo-beta-lactamase n=1 Tax=unclassified Caulobacter TaxID=2648921 RepID=UPI0006FAA649|nr:MULTISPECIES: subclass B3 metallo-beta-lactamase [unclassified Caulobacter]KQY28877.1 subclass B3 metallo-beta-lactamase [Caulobacter sp. Root487D2Y]KQY99033.1 subclass B3 metallo-beta-lactamase [Caulobacter sp. Root1455]